MSFDEQKRIVKKLVQLVLLCYKIKTGNFMA